MLSSMMATPWMEVTWLGEGHTYGWSQPSASCPNYTAALLLRNPPADGKSGLFRRGQPAPDLSGLVDRSGDPVTYLWVIPLTAAEDQAAQQQGSHAAIRELQRRGQGWVWR